MKLSEVKKRLRLFKESGYKRIDREFNKEIPLFMRTIEDGVYRASDVISLKEILSYRFDTLDSYIQYNELEILHNLREYRERETYGENFQRVDYDTNRKELEPATSGASNTY